MYLLSMFTIDTKSKQISKIEYISNPENSIKISLSFRISIKMNYCEKQKCNEFKNHS